MVGLVLVVALGAAAPQTGTAPTLPPQAQEAFKGWFSKGEKLFAEGEYGAAIYAFRQAEQIRATPEVAFDLAKCHDKIGDTAFSTFYYRLYLRRAPTAGDALEVAEILGDVLAKAEANGRGLLEVDGTESVPVSVNGVTYPELPVAVFLAPGDYEVVANGSGFTSKRTAAILNGKVTSVQMDRTPPPLLAVSNDPVSTSWNGDAAVAQADGPTTVTTNRSSGSARPALHTASYAVIGAGVAAVLVGGVLGALSSADRSRLQNDRANLTVTQGRELTNSAAGKASTANLLFIAGGATAVVGGLLFTFTLPEPGKTTEGGASP